MSKRFTALALAASMLALTTGGPAATAVPAARPWMNTALTPDQRTALVVAKMTREEKLRLVKGFFGTDFAPKNFKAPKEARYGSAGYIPGIPRLGIPAQWQTDAGIGVATQGGAPTKRERTALPSGLATTATWNPDLAFQGGAMIGREARLSGFNVMLAGGVNLIRDPRNGRNFEYGGEDPLLAGTMVGAQIAGIQSNKIISTVKHYALNDLETGRDYHDARIDPAAARMSDLLAFQFAIERSDPGSVMCAYNRVNGIYACENPWLLTDVLRKDWGWKGYVMSDWGATHSSAQAANTGLDQQSGYPFDKEDYFGAMLREAVRKGDVSERRLDEMASRILRSMFAHGLVDNPVAIAPIDYAAHAAVTRADAEQGIVLLKNRDKVLPLSTGAKRIVIIGGHADRGVLSGGGSSQTYPVGGNAVPGLEPTSWPGPVVYYPNAPLRAIQALAPGAQVTFVDGSDPAAAARAAADADVALVFVTQWTSESIDTSLTLPNNQDALVEAVAGANPKTVAVLETGGPVLMPWADRVAGIVEAWYPGTAGGEAIANVLFGKVNPSGKLPVTFPRDESQLPRSVRPGTGLANGEMFAIDHPEGAAVGYKWFDAKGHEPLFPFGHGLSYTDFDYGGLRADASSGDLSISFRVKNDGSARGMDVPQVYVAPAAGGWEAPKRLAGFKKIDLAPGTETVVTLTVDPRLLATWNEGAKEWRIAEGEYKVMLGRSSRDIRETESVRIPAKTLPVSWRP
ncbi:glycosyl hydrolase [Sphingomonas parva]|uniref:Glycosyl hydrolase n=1 Tax=Sphingomonas parva TaxID=2555898 RepID=A0A4Y8ZSJ8_9SPHN|nr:glycoside hydrolase family 3 C-terminal domain-containing protein [Sphingomonas parva]TFI58991.1 glycosyl hydrolase [Sphingomonas parva]